MLAAKYPKMVKTTKVTAMNTRLSPTMCLVAACSPGWTNWGRNAKKKIVSLGFSRLMSTAVRITCHADRRLPVYLQRRPVTPGLPGEVEQIGDAHILERLERDSTGVEQRRQPGDRRNHVWDDARSAANCCYDT